MRLAVLGATGGIGGELVRQGLDRGHEITAVVRDASRLAAEVRDRVDVVEADVMDPAAVAPAVKGRDAVLSAMGSRERGPTTVHSGSVAAITEAMRRTGVRRVLTVGAAGAVADAGDAPFTRYVLKPLIVQRLFRDSYADLAASEDLLRRSGLDWTIVRPGRLSDDGPTGRYRTSWDRNLRGGHRTTRADTADCMLTLLDDPASAGHVVYVLS
ncbi:NAD(P)H-binding protein [Actinomadura sp. ATCC 31491]|uniref:NAD(P)H-binding protein n=1 Tax=Actinomadura luzonensis TaxID=2805427 RepID=A0ABT0G498_9ACTN|nr:NAD(P)H-binding protein [Actinomadura luzonensis]MCK2219424.1 NAD(P)H-binding protein [Actinomadura luzonensis]